MCVCMCTRARAHVCVLCISPLPEIAKHAGVVKFFVQFVGKKLIYILDIFYNYMDTFHIGSVCCSGGGEERHRQTDFPN